MKNVKYSILAGIMIGVGGITYLSVESKFLGSFLFTLGLIAIMYQKYHLFTGQVGYLGQKYKLSDLLVTLFFNCVSIAIIGVISSMWLKDKALLIVQNKLSISLLEVFIKAILCGIVIYIAVELFKKDDKGVWTPIYIMAFILCGFEHCVANTFYFATANYFSIEVLIFICVTVIGNALGSILISFLEKQKEEVK